MFLKLPAADCVASYDQNQIIDPQTAKGIEKKQDKFQNTTPDNRNTKPKREAKLLKYLGHCARVLVHVGLGDPLHDCKECKQ